MQRKYICNEVRVLYLALLFNGTDCTITNCFCADRYRSKPSKLQTLHCHADDLLNVIETELDKKFYDIELRQTDNASLSLGRNLHSKSESQHRKYRFLIMIGDREIHNGLPSCLRTRLKNKLHRSIFVELLYYKEGKGVVNQCYYYDRTYKRQGIKITPPMLTSCFFPYTQEGILNLLNHEICCDFNHMIVTDGINLDSSTAPLCGAI